MMRESGPATCRYETPSDDQRENRRKVVVRLAGTDTVKTYVQWVAADGGETNLHAHPHTDGFWYVLTGRSLWYGEDDEVIADLGPNEGIMIPQGTRYWFEAAGGEPLEILHVAVTHGGVDPRSDREDIRPSRPSRRPPAPPEPTATTAPSGDTDT
jgi:mannose-6-phosphate isomerase-like protein (cupin superfamily)